MLSTKLINAINHQTTLVDTLNETRHELEASRERVRQLEIETAGHASMIADGSLLRLADVQLERKSLLSRMTEEAKRRVTAEKDKAAIELELENLTTALFEEANKMVITAREVAQQDHEDMQRRNDQLKAQLADTQALLKSHQEELAGLKQVIRRCMTEKEEKEEQEEKEAQEAKEEKEANEVKEENEESKVNEEKHVKEETQVKLEREVEG